MRYLMKAVLLLSLLAVTGCAADGQGCYGTEELDFGKILTQEPCPPTDAEGTG